MGEEWRAPLGRQGWRCGCGWGCRCGGGGSCGAPTACRDQQQQGQGQQLPATCRAEEPHGRGLGCDKAAMLTCSACSRMHYARCAFHIFHDKNCWRALNNCLSQFFHLSTLECPFSLVNTFANKLYLPYFFTCLNVTICFSNLCSLHSMIFSFLNLPQKFDLIETLDPGGNTVTLWKRLSDIKISQLLITTQIIFFDFFTSSQRVGVVEQGVQKKSGIWPD